MKSLWHTGDRQAILDRLDKLSPGAARLWGTLTPHAAVAHLADSFRMALGEITEEPIRGLLRHQPFKWPAINLIPMPKGVKGPAGYLTIAPTEYEADRSELKRLIDLCAHRPAGEAWGENPCFGRLTKEQ